MLRGKFFQSVLLGGVLASTGMQVRSARAADDVATQSPTASPQLTPMQMAVVDVIRDAVGENAMNAVYEDVAQGNAEVSGITDKNHPDTLLGVEFLIKDSSVSRLKYTSVTRNADGTISRQQISHARMKVFINNSDATMILDQGKPARFVDAKGQTLTKPVPEGVATVYDTPTPGASTAVILLNTAASHGKFAIGELSSEVPREFTIQGQNLVQVDLTQVRFGAGTHVKLTVDAGASGKFQVPVGWGAPQAAGEMASFRTDSGAVINLQMDDQTSFAYVERVYPQGSGFAPIHLEAKDRFASDFYKTSGNTPAPVRPSPPRMQR
jgi:hypothetical protein